ncbi:MAG: hypothetical protein KGH58_04240 [Candidatus Micrarchaeota archaeon]|nr:hypothetical protein [Candidatus Micrarchaeota archaeon]
MRMLLAVALALVALAPLSVAYSPSLLLPNSTGSGGFYDSNTVAFAYTRPYYCTPSANALFQNASGTQASGATNGCELGISGNDLNADPQWIIVPAYAGLTVFGIGASAQGFPVFRNSTVITQCGAGSTLSSCPDHPDYLYSPLFSAVESYMNLSGGFDGLPKGVLPMPSHDHVVLDDEDGSDTNWYTVGVLVFDPNIMPNATNGKCTQVVASNLSDPTGNCLTSLSALAAAMGTSSSSVGAANSGNPIWNALGKPKMQVFIPNDSSASEINNSNSNLKIPFIVENFSYYRGIRGQASGYAPYLLGGVVVIIIVVAAVLLLRRRKRPATAF